LCTGEVKTLFFGTHELLEEDVYIAVRTNPNITRKIKILSLTYFEKEVIIPHAEVTLFFRLVAVSKKTIPDLRRTDS